MQEFCDLKSPGVSWDPGFNEIVNLIFYLASQMSLKIENI